MKFRVTMKDPDTLHDACLEAAEQSLGVIDDPQEREALVEIRADKARKVASLWFEFSELLTVEIDTDAKTCTVIEVRK